MTTKIPANRKKIRKPQQNRSEETRNKILEAGRKMFAIKGYQQTNTKEIAKAAGVSIGSFYAYFEDKGVVFLEITENTYQRIFQVVQETMMNINPSTPRRETIRSLIRALYNAHDIEPDLHREISMMILGGSNDKAPDGADQAVYRKVYDLVEILDHKVQAWLTGLLNQWGGGNPSTDPETAAALIFRAAEETIHRLKQFPASMPESKKILDELIKMIELYLNSAFPLTDSRITDGGL